jgi:hypothetical protein
LPKRKKGTKAMEETSLTISHICSRSRAQAVLRWGTGMQYSALKSGTRQPSKLMEVAKRKIGSRSVSGSGSERDITSFEFKFTLNLSDNNCMKISLNLKTKKTKFHIELVLN